MSLDNQLCRRGHFRFYENENKHSNSPKKSENGGRRKLSKLSIVQHTIGDSHRCIILPSMQYNWHGHYCNTSIVRCIVTPLKGHEAYMS